MGLNELSGVLWRERQLLELLLFKLEEEQLILTSGRTQWLGHATREVESVLDQIRTAELGRAMEAEEAARQLGLEPGMRAAQARRGSTRTVERPAGRAPRGLRQPHRRDQRAGPGQPRAAVRLAPRDARDAARLQETVDTYDPRGGAASAVAGGSHLLDRAL